MTEDELQALKTEARLNPRLRLALYGTFPAVGEKLTDLSPQVTGNPEAMRLRAVLLPAECDALAGLLQPSFWFIWVGEQPP